MILSPAKPPRLRLSLDGLRRRLLVWLLMFLPCTGGPRLLAADAISKEYQLKAAFLYNFTKFVTWSQRAEGPEATLIIGVFGRTPFGDELQRIVQGRSVGGHPIRVLNISSASEARTVHLLFIPAGEERRLAGELDTLHAYSVLTVGEGPAFTALGGIITFSMAADKIRFEINREVALRANLRISPQLLKLSTPASKGNG